jgi:hypothetical protein
MRLLEFEIRSRLPCGGGDHTRRGVNADHLALGHPRRKLSRQRAVAAAQVQDALAPRQWQLGDELHAPLLLVSGGLAVFLAIKTEGRSRQAVAGGRATVWYHFAR